MQPRHEARADPQCIGDFDEHSVRADVARVAAENRGAPFDFEVCPERVAWRPAAFQAPGCLIPQAHFVVVTPCQG